jgi:prophage antirepressor-like protein
VIAGELSNEIILKSRKHQAKLFKRWMFEEVLPMIRKTGKYEVTQPKTAIELAKETIKLAQQNLALLEEMERKTLMIKSFVIFP